MSASPVPDANPTMSGLVLMYTCGPPQRALQDYTERKRSWRRGGRALSLDHHHAMIGTLELDGFVNGSDQIQPVFGQERQHGVEALLQVELRVDQTAEGRSE